MQSIGLGVKRYKQLLIISLIMLMIYQISIYKIYFIIALGCNDWR